MKYTLLITQQCNLRCTYCYIEKCDSSMPLSTANKIVDYIYQRTPEEEIIDIAFFGGEPLLEFKKIQSITALIENHPKYDAQRVYLTIVTNGTVFTSAISEYVKNHNIAFGISCDGPAIVQNKFRRFKNGKVTSTRVDKTIRKALGAFSMVMVNAVYGPNTFQYLPQTVDYLSSLGVRQIYLNPDYSANWTDENTSELLGVYREVGQQYIDFYKQQRPHFVSLIDGKISVLLRDGYQPMERCRMGCGELAFTPQGYIYPCERLVGMGGEEHRIGHIDHGINIKKMVCHEHQGNDKNTECEHCSLSSYCMNWCGCSNYFSSGFYNRTSTFQCASEKAAILVAFEVFQEIENKLGDRFYDHLGGLSINNSIYQPVSAVTSIEPSSRTQSVTLQA